MLLIALLFIILMMNYFCERVAVSVCRTINCLFCEDFLPSAYLLLCDLGSGAYLLLCDALLEARKDCLWKRKLRFLQREYFASYKEKISLVILWRKKHQSGENAEANAPLCRSYRPKNCIQSSFLYLLSWELLRPSKPSFAFFLREGLAS